MRKAKHAHRSEHDGSGLSFVLGFFVNFLSLVAWGCIGGPLGQALGFVGWSIGLFLGLFLLNRYLGVHVEESSRTGRAYFFGCCVFYAVVGALIALTVATSWRHYPGDAAIGGGMGAALCLGIPYLTARVVRRTRRRNTPGMCPKCCYSFEGLASIRCPECGWERQPECESA